jgi:ribonuclease-3
LSRPAALEQRLGHRFTRVDLLEQALTHASFGSTDNERLEFLGDAVLGCAIAEELFARFPDLPEGKLTRLRAALVREESLAEIAAELELSGFLRIGAPGPRASILADALEAVFGAVLLDGGYPAARSAIVRVFSAVLDRLDPDNVDQDAKTRLQEMLHARHQNVPEYRVVATSGADHQRSFEVECVLAGLGLRATGAGSSRQRADQAAAQAMLAMLGKA